MELLFPTKFRFKLDVRNLISIILAFIIRLTLSNAFEVKFLISEVTVLSNSSEKLDKAKNDGISKEILTREIHKMIINVPSLNFDSVHLQILIL